MGRFTVVALLLAQLIAISMANPPDRHYPVPSCFPSCDDPFDFPKCFPFCGRHKRGVGYDDTANRGIFALLDSNNDGQLDAIEWDFEWGRGLVPPFSELIRDYDDNADGMISLEEFLAAPHM